MTRFVDKTVLVTGGTSGIGLAGARRLVSEGASVIVTGRDPDRTRAVQQRFPDLTVVLDDAADPDTGEALARVVGEHEGLDALWLNAGRAVGGPLGGLDAAAIDALFAVNVRGPMLQLAALAPLLRDGGSVLVTASTAVYEAEPEISLYAATKGALLSAARSWAAELAPRGIRVNSLVPGPITSNLRSGLPEELRDDFEDALAGRVLLGRVGDPREAAALALFLLSDDASYITGSSHLVDGGMLML